MKPIVSIIITTKNEEKNIFNCLNSIRKQTYPQDRIEIIVVDNNSTDKTVEIAKEFTSLIFHHGPERSAQRNLGVKKATGDYILYLDADMTLSPEVVAVCLKKLSNEPDIIGLYISEIVTGKSFFSQARRFERSFYDGTAIDCVRLIRKDVFEKVGGFDEHLTGPEDWDLDKRIRKAGKVALVKTPIYHNESEFDFKKYLAKKEYYIQKIDAYVAKWGKDDPDVKKQLGLYYRFFGVYFEKGKWRKLFAHPLLTLGMYFLRVLVGFKFLFR